MNQPQKLLKPLKTRTLEPERQGVEGTVTYEDICQGFTMAGKAAEENLLMVGGV